MLEIQELQPDLFYHFVLRSQADGHYTVILECLLVQTRKLSVCASPNSSVTLHFSANNIVFR